MDSKIHNFIGKLLLGIILSMVFMLTITACATAPVQEMSDARQAIQAAKSVGVDEFSQSNLMQAKKLLKKAEHALHTGEYKQARVNALAAKEEAIQAQQYANLTKF
jgi:Tfp pilus assembly protein PilF